MRPQRAYASPRSAAIGGRSSGTPSLVAKPRARTPIAASNSPWRTRVPPSPRQAWQTLYG